LVEDVRVVGDEHTFDLSPRRDPSGSERHRSIPLLIRRVQQVVVLSN
jgi:hypothetical protein